MAIIFEKVLALKFNQKWVASRYDIEKNQMYNTFEAEVPGNIQYDYAKANNFGDFQFSDNVKKFDEIEDYAWIYCTELDYVAKNDEHQKGAEYLPLRPAWKKHDHRSDE